MKVLGIDFVPLNLPLKNRLEAIAAGIWYFLFMGLPLFGIFTTIYILFFTKFWPLMYAYLFWIWVLDKDVGETGGQPSEWVRSWTLFKYVVNYFPITIKAVPGFYVDPKKNYLCCSFPHGFLPVGVTSAFVTYGNKEAKNIMPHHSMYASTLHQNFFIPIFRDYLLAMGICSATPKSFNYILSYPGGGKVLGLVVGGVSESFLCQQNDYRLVLKDRKGFIKLALKNGSPIIPTFSFGQNNCFKLKEFPEGSIIRKIQYLLKHLTGFAFPVIHGRGLFQYTFGYIPLQKPINIAVGTPIEVPKIENPTQEEIDSLHEIFIEKLFELFNQYKYEYEENPEKCSFTIT